MVFRDGVGGRDICISIPYHCFVKLGVVDVFVVVFLIQADIVVVINCFCAWGCCCCCCCFSVFVFCVFVLWVQFWTTNQNIPSLS